MLSRPAMGLLIAGIIYTHSGCIRSDESQPSASQQFSRNRSGHGSESAETHAAEATIDLSDIQLGQRWRFEIWLSPAQAEMNMIPGKRITEGRVVSLDGAYLKLSDWKPRLPGFGEHCLISKSSIQSITRIAPPMAPAHQVSAK